MNRIVAWFATNHVAANLLMGFAVLAGLAALTQIPVRVYPDLEVPLVTVTVPYLGAAPEEVESGVCIRIEDQLEGIVGIKEMRSIADEGLCTVQVSLFFDADPTTVLGEVETQVNAIDTFPEQTEKPIVRLVALANVVSEIAVTGPTDERALKELARRVRDDILRQPGITHASVANTRPYEISIELSQRALLRNRLTFDDVAAAVRERSVDLPGGSIKTDQGELLLRTRGQAYWGLELENLVMTARDDGTRVLLKDVARVVDGFADTSQALRFNGKPAALVQVSRVGNQDLREISETVRRYVDRSAGRYPEGVELTLWNDESTLLTDRLGALVDSGVQGLLMVLVLLALFLRPHLALWVGAGIPIAFLGAIFLVYWFGFSLDSVSLVGFILALGMLVDDAVVVGESTYVSHRRGAGQLAGAIEGAQRVMLPVTFGVLTTAAAFMPLLFVVGPVGELMAGVSATVLCCLAFSLIECQMVLPAHLGHRSARMPLGEFGMTFLVAVVIAGFAIAPDMRSGMGLAVAAAAAVYAAHLLGGLSSLGAAFARVQVRFESALEWFVSSPFRTFAERSLRARHLTLAIAFAAIASAIGFVSSGHLSFTFMESAPADRVVARLTMPLGVSERETRGVIEQLSGAGQRLKQQLAAEDGESPVLHILEAMGGHPSTAIGVGMPEPFGSHLGEVALQLTPSTEREISTAEITNLWREAHGPVPATAELAYVSDRITAGNDVGIRIYGDDTDALLAVATAIKRKLTEYPGLSEIADSFRPGKEELKLSVTPAGEALGITLTDLGRQVRQAFYGEEAQRIQRGPDDVRIMVRYTAEERGLLESLYDLRIRTPKGGDVPFQTVAEVEAGRGVSNIVRTRGARSINITAKVDLLVTTAGAVIADLQAQFLPEILANYPGVSYTLENMEQQEEVAESLLPLVMLGMFAVFALLAIPLRSYTQPLIIMTVLPFAFVGAIWGHILMKGFGYITGLSMASVFGIVAASGVVINATLILLHGVNRYRAAGDSLHDALINGAVSRFRPILITSVTTFAGLMPLMLSTSVATQTLSPMAVALAFGVVVSSVAALVVVPSLWLVLHDIFTGARRVTDLLGDLIGGAPRLSMWMARYPYVQESLRTQEFTDLQLPDDLGLDPEEERVARRGLVRLFYEREFDAREMRARLDAIAKKAPMADDLVGEARTWAEQRTFQLGVHMLRGVIAPMDAARPLSDILDTCMGTLLSAAKREFTAEHGEIANGRIALVALGALGRREFATGGPVQLLFLYDHDPVTTGVPGLSPQDWHTQLLQRFMRLVGDLSPEGILYDARPAYSLPGAGAACAITALREHFNNATSVAELRMLAHARVIEAEGDLGTSFEAFRESVLSQPQDRSAVAADISIARTREAEQHRTGDTWDVLHGPGGLADMELAAEYLQLTGAGPVVRGLVPAFEGAAGHGLIDTDVAADFSRAATLWQNLDGFFRMACADSFDPRLALPDQKATIAEACEVESFEVLPRTIADVAGCAATHLGAMLADTAETA